MSFDAAYWLSAKVIWGLIFVVIAIWLFWRDHRETASKKVAEEKVKQAQADVEAAANANARVQESVRSLGGGFRAAQFTEGAAIASGAETSAADAAQKLADAKEKLTSLLNDALGELGKTHPMMIVGFAFLALAAGAFGVPIPFLNPTP